MRSMRVRAATAAAAVCLMSAAIVACGSANSAGPGSSAATVPGVGSLPPVLASGDVPGVAQSPRAADGAANAAGGATLAERATGNRLLLIGDSILSSISRRYGNHGCEALVPQGWQVAIEAEKSRPIGFGLQVLDRVLDAGWDAFVILLGNNYGKNQDAYRAQLEEMLDRIGERPVLLLTVTEFEPVQRQVNDVITAVAAARSNVLLLDWAAITEDPDLLGDDGLHLSGRGREVLASNIAAVAGTVEGAEGECLRSRYTDEQADEPSQSAPERTTGTTRRRSSSGSSTPATTRPPASASTTASTSATTPASTSPNVTPSVSTPIVSTPVTTAPPKATTTAAGPSGSTVSSGTSESTTNGG